MLLFPYLENFIYIRNNKYSYCVNHYCCQVSKMKKAIGIDLGTTNSAIAVLEGGKPSIIVSAEGGRTTPSVVAFSKDGERLVGSVAKRQSVINPEGTVFSAKRFIGRKFKEVKSEIEIVPYKVVAGENDAVRFSINSKNIAPEEISAKILRKLADDAAKFVGEKVSDVVITVPAYFNDNQRQSTKDAAKIAGLNVLRIINEPTAAALAYGLEKDKNETILVFDLGGGTFDVSILEVGDGVCEVKSTSGDTHLGGDDFDKAVVDYLAEEFKNAQGIDLRQDKQALQRLYEAAEKAKIELSQTMQATVNLPFITADANGPKHLNTTLSKATFDKITRDLVMRCKIPMEQALNDAKLSKDSIDEVILVGGSSRIPAIQALVEDFTGKKPNMSVNPDEVVALGAATQAGIISGQINDVLLLDVTPLSLGVETLGGVMTPIISRNTTIPARKSQVFSTAEDNQPAVDIVILQGERKIAQNNKRLGLFKLDGITPAPRGLPQIEVTFDIDANGILKVNAQDKATGKEQHITISGSTNLDKSEIDKMVADAQSHMEEDKKQEELINEQNQADALAYQTERVLNDLRDKISSTEKSRAEQLIENIRKAIKDKEPVNKIKSLKTELEQLAHTIAALQYEQTNSQCSGGSCGNPPQSSGDDVIDAEFAET